MIRYAALILVCLSLISNVSSSQQKEDGKNTYEELKKELLQLRAQLDTLKLTLAAAQTDPSDELDVVSERLEKRMRELENKIGAVSRATAPIVFNPRTTAFINFAARGDDKAVLDESGIAKIDNRPFLRTVELDFRAPVDPYADAVVILSLEDKAGTGFGVDAEEAYGVLKQLPILESAPLGLKLKVGKFRAPFGVNNKLHMHDLPWTTRPLIVSRYLGTEHGDFFESGYNPVGVDFDFFLPNPVSGTTLEMNLDVVRAGELALLRSAESKQPGYLAHVNLSADWNNEHILVLGASGYREGGSNSMSLLGFDATYRWAPSERRESRSFVVGGEAFFGRRSFQDSMNAEFVQKPYGWFAYTQYQLSYWLYVGARYDWLQEPADEKLTTKSWSLYGSYYTTEFLRLRLGFEHRQSDISAQDNRNTVHFEINFVFGAHPTEPYWVNR